ncbi:MAG: hypothetical protein IJJ33_03380 [Victivallales bacterium]|nr:hypothetical protein [Victivallales bacterium]
MMSFFGIGKDKQEEQENGKKPFVLPEEQRENLEADIKALGDEDGKHEQKLQKDAEREVQNAAADSLKKIHKVNLGRCPVCGEHLVQTLTANICAACGWNKYDTPRSGKIIVHLKDSDGTVEGNNAYILKDGDCLVIRGEVVFARIPHDSYTWIEYDWTEDELKQRRKQVDEQIHVKCGWCNEDCDLTQDGFHLVHVAFGTSQERYCFCSDDCYEAFRKMYPARVHRNCYERDCNDCNLCVKRYGDEAEGIRTLAKDRLRVEKKND